jgi:protein-S-isoprenylcysteine O-methyltransferase Ste14
MYAGYVITQIGFLLAHPSLWNASIYAATLVFQIGRILAEERLLSRDSGYREFAALVPSRLVPGVF